MHDFKNYTVESVTSGHPDKVCDQISDAVLDECLRQDPKSRVAIESFGSHGLLVVGGELTTSADFDAAAIAKKLYKDIGYTNELKIITNIVKQSPDIAQGVDTGGAGDQGIMYGYATDETPEFLPKAVVLVHKLAAGLEKLRKTNKEFSWIKPDGKTQVTIQNNEVRTILVSTQHDAAVEHDFIQRELIRGLIGPAVGDISGIEILVNPTGRFVQGGFEADTGLTGRKIMVDTYGGLIPHGGGCFSGKDPTKVDRSAAYMARFAAKNIVANGLAKKCMISVAYAIGRAEPLMVEAEDENGKSLSEVVKKNFDFRPAAIIERLNLRRPIYLQTAAYGHFGRPGLPWEEIVSIKK
jgi:S-adenosylmethionine synthetase